MKGTSTLKPTQPKTTDGMPTNNSIAGCKTLCAHFGPTSVRNKAAAILSGVLIRIAKSVTSSEPTMNVAAP